GTAPGGASLRNGGAAMGTAASAVCGDAAGAAARDRQVRQLDPESACLGDGGDERGGLAGIDLPCLAAGHAVEMAVLVVRHDVELLATVGGMAVADEAELLEDVERSVGGR